MGFGYDDSFKLEDVEIFFRFITGVITLILAFIVFLNLVAFFSDMTSYTYQIYLFRVIIYLVIWIMSVKIIEKILVFLYNRMKKEVTNNV